LHVADGPAAPFDLVIFADGANSEARQRIFPSLAPAYAGYVAWRGLVPASLLPRPASFADCLTFAIHEHAHIILYYVPGNDGSVEPRDQMLNWVWYDPMPESDLDRLLRPVGSDQRATSLPPGAIPEAEWAHLCERARDVFPSVVSEVIAATVDPFMQPIVDIHIPSYVRGRTCLLGDASSVARPHTASGANKAMTQAIALADALESNDSVEAALRAWDSDATKLGATLVERGREMGRLMVTDSPPWREMTPAAIQRWLTRTFVPGYGGRTPLVPGAPGSGAATDS
jgi:2-polyprenyl-6-methoxyphenol hydroxylase-like FAD-dependent oxidoreductase